MDLSYKLEQFEGPLDVLLRLIEKNKVDIFDIPIVTITDQYLDFVNHLETEDLDLVSDFLVMAATLLDIKSRMLLPREEEEEEEDPRDELVRRLLEYKMYRFAAEEFRDNEKDAERRVFKGPDIPDEVKKYEPPVDMDKLLDGVTMERLAAIFQSVLKRQEYRKDPVRSRFGTIKREKVSLTGKIRSVLKTARTKKKVSFKELLEGQKDRLHVVVAFLAVLELMKLGQIELSQEALFDDMTITAKGGAENAEDLDLSGLEEDFDEQDEENGIEE